MLLHFTRLTITLRKAADRPIGYVGSAVMINVKLKPKMTLLHVIGLTRSLGEQLSEKDVQPEVYRWTDPGDVTLTCEFLEGKLMKWSLQRPPEMPETPGTTGTTGTPEPSAAEAGGAPR